MLFSERMTPEEKKRFFERKRLIDKEFQALDQKGQAKVLDTAAKLNWRRLVKMRHGRLLILKFLCRELTEQEENKILAQIEKLLCKRREGEDSD